MMPFFDIDTIPFVFINLSTPMVFLLVAILVAGWYWQRLLKEQGEDIILNKTLDVVLVGFVGALFLGRLTFLLFYQPDLFLGSWREWFTPSVGGFSEAGVLLGGGLALAWMLRKQVKRQLRFLLAVMVLPVGLAIYRFGEYLTGDFTGIEVPYRFFLATQAPHSAVHHDISFYLFLSALGLVGVFWYFYKKQGKHFLPFIPGIFLLWHGATRLFFDLLKHWSGEGVETRYLHWTPAQYISVLAIALGVYLLLKQTSKKGRDPAGAGSRE